MRDPYEILGVKRGASLDEVKAAYRRACKERHPDLGGSHEAMVELNTAYAFILNELKQGYQNGTGRGAGKNGAPERARRPGTTSARRRATTSATIVGATSIATLDEELETIRRAAEQYDEQLRTMRRAAWQTGRRVDWAKLTWDDLFGFLRRTARSGIKGIALLFAALVGVGSVLVEANVVSALILLGSGLGFAFSLALKSDKGGMLSAALLLFGIMTIWLPPVRSALVMYPLGTICVLILLALIFKFAQAGGTFGFMTGGVLALYVIGVIVSDTSQQPTNVTTAPPQTSPPSHAPVATQAARPTPTPAPSPSIARVAPQAPPPRSTARPRSTRAPDASRGRRRNPQIRCRRPVPPESANRPIDLAASDRREGRVNN